MCIRDSPSNFLLFLFPLRNWTTKIVLPLKKEMQHAKLTSRFYDIHPSLLMFLNRLHSIIIDDKVLTSFIIRWQFNLKNPSLIDKLYARNQNFWQLFYFIKVAGTVKVMKKEIIDKNLVKLTENEASTLWFVVSKEIPIQVCFVILFSVRYIKLFVTSVNC